MFPKAQSLDVNFNIQIESDFTGNGGVTPDIRVPLDDATIGALSAGRDVVLEQAEAALRAQAALR
jgi:carboxyl-terminal processing protease